MLSERAGDEAQAATAVTANDIQLVQNLVERCLQVRTACCAPRAQLIRRAAPRRQLCLPQREVVSILQQHAKIDPEFTALVWEKLEEQNRDFFDAYYLRMRLKDQVLAFNSLLEEQAALARIAPAAGWLGGDTPNGGGGLGGFGALSFAHAHAGAFDDPFTPPVGHCGPHVPHVPHTHGVSGVGGVSGAPALHAHAAAFPPATHAGQAGGQHAHAAGMPYSFSLSDLAAEPLMAHAEPLGSSFAHGPDSEAQLALLAAMDGAGAATVRVPPGGVASLTDGMKRECSLARLPHTFSLSDIAAAMFSPHQTCHSAGV
jgi:uncharacterized protein (TIGR01589 family)